MATDLDIAKLMMRTLRWQMVEYACFYLVIGWLGSIAVLVASFLLNEDSTQLVPWALVVLLAQLVVYVNVGLFALAREFAGRKALHDLGLSHKLAVADDQDLREMMKHGQHLAEDRSHR